ncbi:MAG: 1,2-phenylacetyl-CoA epoxidase subunit PaaC [Phycisphaerae bacterium]
MSVFETLDALTGPARHAAIDLLYRMADDELIIGHRHSEWTGYGPILEEDIAFSSMAQDEMGHALTFYTMLHELGEAAPDTLVFERKPREFRCSNLVSMDSKRDWALTVVRSFLYEAQESVRLAALTESSLKPLADVARKLQCEEKYHFLHGRSWMLRLGSATEEAHAKMQQAVCKTFPHALGMFEPTGADQTLAQHDLCPREAQLQREWESAIAPVLADAGLELPEDATTVCGGRVGRHIDDLAALLKDLQLVHSMDTSASW